MYTLKLPYGFKLDDQGEYVLELRKYIYGLTDAPYTSFQKLTDGLNSEGFKRSEIDQCVFLRHVCIIMLYVNDMIALSKNAEVLYVLVYNLKQKDYILTDEGTLTGYLGVDVMYRLHGRYELKQTFLIQRIIDLMSLEGEVSITSKIILQRNYHSRKAQKVTKRRILGVIGRILTYRVTLDLTSPWLSISFQGSHKIRSCPMSVQ